jgi:putative DNA primase/helicase
LSLRAIVQTVGGELAANGTQALIPAPGHSEKDRSVSLRLNPEGRVLVHCFGDSKWTEVVDMLRQKGLIDEGNRITSSPGISGSRACSRGPAPTDSERIATAHRIWEGGVPIGGTLAAKHLALRHVGYAAPMLDSSVARFRLDTPISVYSTDGKPYLQPALLVAIRDPSGKLTAIEITYLNPAGRRAGNLKVPRKTVGVTPPSTAMRLMPAKPAMLVAEGFFTTLSACKRLDLGRPGWALQSIRNLLTWQPPEGVRDVLIAGDRGRGAKHAAALKTRLIDQGFTASVALPPAPYDDWNDYDAALTEQEIAQAQAAARGRPPGAAAGWPILTIAP